MTGRLFTTILALAVSVRALAAGYDDFADLGRKPHRRNIRTEWGITAGAHYTGIRLFGQEASMKASPRLGYEAGVHMALRFGDWLALQPEIYYSHTTIDMQADGVDDLLRELPLQVLERHVRVLDHVVQQRHACRDLIGHLLRHVVRVEDVRHPAQVELSLMCFVGYACGLYRQSGVYQRITRTTYLLRRLRNQRPGSLLFFGVCMSG